VLPSDAGYQCFPDDPNKVRKPDLSFIQAARLAVEDEPEGWATIAPDLAVEVISPNDLFEAVSIKVREYLAAGVRLVWVIDTATQMVYVYPHDRRGEILTQEDDLSGEGSSRDFSAAWPTSLPHLWEPNRIEAGAPQ